MPSPQVTPLTNDPSADYVFKITLPGFTYKVTLSNEYYRELTSEKIDPAQLVKTSFEFLLEREGPESILKEFDLPLIGTYFSEYEREIRRRIHIS